MLNEAMFYSSKPEGKVQCNLCPHYCLLKEDETGLCRVRVNKQGRLMTGVYGKIAAIHTDPIEKKPLYHFYPGSEILSVGTPGCNLRCSFCQNYALSQYEDYTSNRNMAMPPHKLVEKAKANANNIGIAYTYNEPTIFYEMMLETAALAKTARLKNVVVSNGYIMPKPLEKLLEVTDAFNIDLKAFNDAFYRDYAGGHLQPLLKTLKSIHNSGRHLEITLLVIPTLNDDINEFEQMTEWIANTLSPDVPLHLSRYFPSWKMDIPPTPTETLLNFARIAGNKLRYVYTGNMADSYYSSTWCYNCKKLLIKRERYFTSVSGISSDGKCMGCGTSISVIL